MLGVVGLKGNVVMALSYLNCWVLILAVWLAYAASLALKWLLLLLSSNYACG